MENWVDFRAVKAAVSVQQVLDHYHINWLRKSGDELRGRCPIHQGEGTDTFHVNMSKNAFQCFAGSCKKRGNVLDLVAAMEKCSVRDAALKLAEWFSVSSPEQGSRGESKESKVASSLPLKKIPSEPERPVNKPLTFKLKGVDPSHPYLAARGISRETAELFGVGFFSGKGSMAGRIVIPIHNDERGELVAYAGRSIDGSEPRYKLPAGFHKSQVLYNLDLALKGNSTGVVVLVEGFFDCMKLWQAGKTCVALMGSSMSKDQEELLVRHFLQVVLMFDADASGKSCAGDCLERLSRRMFVRVVNVPEGKQPDQLAEIELQELLK